MAAEEVAAACGVAAAAYDGESAETLARRLGVPRVVLYASAGSTMDEAHAVAADGTPAGTIVIADMQTRGRGRQGARWHSPGGRGIWLTLVERPTAVAGVEVLALRVGLHAARALDAFAPAPVQLKWPNDLYAGGRKLAGILVEARWRGLAPDWVAIGVGVNVVPPPEVAGATGLRDQTSRLDVLADLVPALRAAAARAGPLDAAELREFAGRDYARGRRCAQPSPGVVRGVTPTGELAVETPAGIRYYRAGSLVLEESA